MVPPAALQVLIRPVWTGNSTSEPLEILPSNQLVFGPPEPSPDTRQPSRQQAERARDRAAHVGTTGSREGEPGLCRSVHLVLRTQVDTRWLKVFVHIQDSAENTTLSQICSFSSPFIMMGLKDEGDEKRSDYGIRGWIKTERSGGLLSADTWFTSSLHGLWEKDQHVICWERLKAWLWI